MIKTDINLAQISSKNKKEPTKAKKEQPIINNLAFLVKKSNLFPLLYQISKLKLSYGEEILPFLKTERFNYENTTNNRISK